MRQPAHASKFVAKHHAVTKAEDRRLPEGGKDTSAQPKLEHLNATILL